jgi:hypothetical protein
VCSNVWLQTDVHNMESMWGQVDARHQHVYTCEMASCEHGHCVGDSVEQIYSRMLRRAPVQGLEREARKVQAW